MVTMSKLKSVFIFVILSSLIFFSSATLTKSDSIDVRSGTSYYLTLESLFDTTRWAGLQVVNNNTPVDIIKTTTPFLGEVVLNQPVIGSVSFPGGNLKSEPMYYAALQSSTFSLNNVVDADLSDLDEEGLFPSSRFPVFYPNYHVFNDNPSNTFVEGFQTVQIGGRNFTALTTTLDNGITYYLLKYDIGSEYIPFFLVDFDDHICFDGSSCVAQFMLPLSNEPYNFYLLSQFPVYDFTVFIDSVQTTVFAQTALPYVVEIQAVEIYSGDIGSDLDILIGETKSQNIFIPVDLVGFFSESYAMATTDSSGSQTFLITPTVYPSNPDYSIYVALLRDGFISNRKELTVQNADQLPLNPSKPLSPSLLYDNAKVSVNAMNQIVSFMFRWANQQERAISHQITYNVNTNSFAPVTTEFKTGAPNLVTLSVIGGFGYYGIIAETDGYLLMSPYTGDSPFSQSTRVHASRLNPGQQLIVTPTSLGVIDSQITIEIYNSNDQLVNSISVPIDATLNFNPGDGVPFSNNALKTSINSMFSIVSTQFVALNT